MNIYETERLLIRRWHEKDAHDLYEYASDNEVTRFLRFPAYMSLDDAVSRIKSMNESYSQFANGDLQTEIDFAIEQKITGKVIGSIGFVGYKENAGRSIEIGYIMNPQHQGKGFMTEALVGMFKYVVGNDLALRIEAKHDIENKASGRVMQKAGMTFEGIRRKGTSNNTNSRADCATYAILCEEVK
ncbi:MAG: GNAT family N-acetyltransferase [Firmicutes bacterium]|nr:GNAT family N-acetyltransferase [Bacillota bacterium]